MKHKSVIALRRKEKYGLLMGPFFGIKSVKEAEDAGEGKEDFTVKENNMSALMIWIYVGIAMLVTIFISVTVTGFLTLEMAKYMWREFEKIKKGWPI